MYVQILKKAEIERGWRCAAPCGTRAVESYRRLPQRPPTQSGRVGFGVGGIIGQIEQDADNHGCRIGFEAVLTPGGIGQQPRIEIGVDRRRQFRLTSTVGTDGDAAAAFPFLTFPGQKRFEGARICLTRRSVHFIRGQSSVPQANAINIAEVQILASSI
jgi:hypothetical protein